MLTIINVTVIFLEKSSFKKIFPAKQLCFLNLPETIEKSRRNHIAGANRTAVLNMGEQNIIR
jgi:hypothetical protein